MKTFNYLILIALMCLQSQLINGQTSKGGSILYEVVPKPFSARTLSKGNTKEYTKDFSKAHKMFFELKFDETQALYEKLSFDDLNAKMVVDKSTGTSSEVKTFGSYQRTTYTDLREEVILNFLRDGRAVKHSFDKDEWTITDETKIIGGYTSYKATKENKVKVSISSDRQNPSNGNFDRKFITTVWFTKEIPNKFGPSIYSGFPGLVLEVESDLFRITAKEVKVDVNQEIKKPKADNIISFEDYKSKNLKNNSLN